MEIVEAQYYTREMGVLDVPLPHGIKAALRLRFKTTAGLTFDKTLIKSLVLHLRGDDETPMHLYEQFLANAKWVVARPTSKPVAWRETLRGSCIGRGGV